MPRYPMSHSPMCMKECVLITPRKQTPSDPPACLGPFHLSNLILGVEFIYPILHMRKTSSTLTKPLGSSQDYLCNPSLPDSEAPSAPPKVGLILKENNALLRERERETSIYTTDWDHLAAQGSTMGYLHEAGCQSATSSWGPPKHWDLAADLEHRKKPFPFNIQSSGANHGSPGHLGEVAQTPVLLCTHERASLPGLQVHAIGLTLWATNCSYSSARLPPTSFDHPKDKTMSHPCLTPG